MAMRFVKGYLLPRLVQYVLVVFFGITAVFFIIRIAPIDPVQEMISQLQSWGTTMDPVAVERIVATLRELYGLEGSLLDQYVSLWKRIFTFDFGPSYFQFPTPVSKLIRMYFPWTAGLLLTTMLLQWILGNVLGGIAGYFSQSRWSKFLDMAVMVIRPLPHYIVGLLFLILFGYVWRLFPIGRGFGFGRQAVFELRFILDVLRHSFLPALTIVILGGAVWFQQMKLLVQNVKNEDFVQYAKWGGVRDGRIVFRYVIPNAMLPQITQLALLLGQIFGGMLIIEIVFSYPGMGTLLYNAILRGDYNLIMAITTMSILLISTTVLIVDLLYPLFDPRIRYR
jgi:peptide/nickel transport system permease protein